MEVNDNIEINVRRIGNGYIASVSKQSNYNSARLPQTFFSTFEDVLAEIAGMAAVGAALEVSADDEDCRPF